MRYSRSSPRRRIGSKLYRLGAWVPIYLRPFSGFVDDEGEIQVILEWSLEMCDQPMDSGAPPV